MYSAHSDPSGHRTLHKVVKIQVTFVRRYFAQDAADSNLIEFARDKFSSIREIKHNVSRKISRVKSFSMENLSMLTYPYRSVSQF